MDWVCDASNTQAAGTAQAMVIDQLRRRALTPSQLNAAAAMVEAAFEEAPRDAEVWAHLDWEHEQPTLALRFSQASVLPRERAHRLAEGVWAMDELGAGLLERYAAPAVKVTLPVSRPPEADLDLVPDHQGGQGPGGFLGTVAATMAGHVELGATLAEAAVVAGATAATSAQAAYAAGHGGRAPATAAEVAEAFINYHNAAGSDFFLVEASDRRAVLSNRACPFGPAVSDRPVMCRTTSALLGSLAARANGRAGVVLDEAIALGDHRCRLVLDLEAPPSRWSHTYNWPPAGLAGQSETAQTRGFRVALSLRLPRDRLSVSLIRHMTSYALAAVGTRSDDIADVEVAITEAATNVIKHSGAGDAYDVEVTVGPALVELRVIDVGRGFDSEAIALLTAQPDDEQGRGVALMNALVDQARFISAPERGTIVHLIKRLRFDDDAPARRLMLAALAEQDKDQDEQDKDQAAQDKDQDGGRQGPEYH